MIHKYFRSTLMLLSGLHMALTPALSSAAMIDGTLQRPAVMLPDIRNVALLGIATAGRRLVAVGERGIIGLSDDEGKTWRQVPSPVSVTLTAVRFADARHGWATGHRGVVLHSVDAGQTWTRQLDGASVATLMATYALKLEGGTEAGHVRTAQSAAAARQIAKDGPDKPFFDLYFRDVNNGIVIGAYGLVMTTADGGKTWRPAMHLFDNPKGLHLYAVHGLGNTVYIAGEQGMLLRSFDDGATFDRLQTPYRGSYFVVSAAPSGRVVVAGLNGNAYWSADRGASWAKIDLPTATSFSALFNQTDGTLLLGDQAGNLFLSRDAGQSFHSAGAGSALPLSGMTRSSAGALIGVGLRGVVSPASISGSNKK